MMQVESGGRKERRERRLSRVYGKGEGDRMGDATNDHNCSPTAPRLSPDVQIDCNIRQYASG